MISADQISLVSIGCDALLVLADGQEVYSTISNVLPFSGSGGGQYTVSVKLPEITVSPAITGTMKIKKTSADSGLLLPLAAIQNDGVSPNAGYVLVVREKSTIMGTQTVAEKTPVQIVDYNDTNALVIGVLSNEDRIILESDKAVVNGDRVRVIDGL
jgi:hypothetical protein